MNKQQFRMWLDGQEDPVATAEEIYKSTAVSSFTRSFLPSKKELKEVLDEYVCDSILLGKDQESQDEQGQIRDNRPDSE